MMDDERDRIIQDIRRRFIDDMDRRTDIERQTLDDIDSKILDAEIAASLQVQQVCIVGLIILYSG